MLYIWVFIVTTGPYIVCYARLSIWDIFHLHILITWVWPIMEDIEPINLGLGNRPKEFETMTHPTFWSKQYYIHVHTLTFWTSWPIHNERCMSLLFHNFAWLFLPYIYYSFHSFFDPTRYGLRWLDLRWALHLDGWLMMRGWFDCLMGLIIIPWLRLVERLL